MVAVVLLLLQRRWSPRGAPHNGLRVAAAAVASSVMMTVAMTTVTTTATVTCRD